MSLVFLWFLTICDIAYGTAPNDGGMYSLSDGELLDDIHDVWDSSLDPLEDSRYYYFGGNMPMKYPEVLQFMLN